MTSNTLQAIATEDLTAMLARVYRQLREACQVADSNGTPRHLSGKITELDSAYLRYDDELIEREKEQTQ